MLPAKPPLPWPRNFPFHPFTGIHTSIGMAESVLGVAITWTRQNSGRRPSSAFCAGWSVELSGGVNAPAATAAAETTFAPGNVSDASFAHVSSLAGAGCDHATENESAQTAVIAKCFNT